MRASLKLCPECGCVLAPTERGAGWQHFATGWEECGAVDRIINLIERGDIEAALDLHDSVSPKFCGCGRVVQLTDDGWAHFGDGASCENPGAVGLRARRHRQLARQLIEDGEV